VSVLEEFRDAEERVVQRLKELEPAVAEYRELEKLARRLGVDVKGANGAGAPAAVTSGGAGTAARGRTRSRTARSAAGAKATATGRRTSNAPPGRRAEELLAVVRRRPGVTVRDAAAEMGVDPTGLYRIVRRLEKTGELRKSGRSLEASTGA
jgi:hypothetical protein